MLLRSSSRSSVRLAEQEDNDYDHIRQLPGNQFNIPRSDASNDMHSLSIGEHSVEELFDIFDQLSDITEDTDEVLSSLGKLESKNQ